MAKEKKTKNKEKQYKQIVSEKELDKIMNEIGKDISKFTIVCRFFLDFQTRFLYKSVDSYLFLLKEDKKIADKFFINVYMEYFDFLYKNITSLLLNDDDLALIWSEEKAGAEELLKKCLDELEEYEEKEKIEQLNTILTLNIQSILFLCLAECYNFTEKEVDIIVALMHVMSDNVISTSEEVFAIVNEYYSLYNEEECGDDFKEEILHNINKVFNDDFNY